MHIGDPKKQVLPEKWLADLLSKALLLEYQHPAKLSKRKNRRSVKRARLQGKKNRAARESLENEHAANRPLTLNEKGRNAEILLSIRAHSK